MEFVSRASEGGVVERGFTLRVGDAAVPGILWTPEGATGPRPLVLIGHGGTQHKRVENVLRLARSLVSRHGYAAVAIDAPDHGDRGTPEGMARLREQIVSGQFGPEQRRKMAADGARAATEWRATLDAVERLPEVSKGAVGYWGLSMGTAFGVPFVATDPRVRCAIFGLFGLRLDDSRLESAARKITVPVLFLLQLNDELVPLPFGLALFQAFSSQIKTMHLNPGGHVAVPVHEREEYETFIARHL